MDHQLEIEPKNVMPLFGMAAKSFFEMNLDERAEAHLAALRRAKEAAFTRGLPIIYGVGELIIAEYSNGKKFIRENGKDIAPFYG